MTSITIPESVTSVGDYAFYDCKELVDVHYAGTQEQWDNIDMGEEVFIYFDEDSEEDVSIPYTLHCKAPEVVPTEQPTVTPSQEPSEAPSQTPSAAPSEAPSQTPSAAPSEAPSQTPSAAPSEAPSQTPSAAPSEAPSRTPSAAPSAAPSKTPEASVPATGTRLKEDTGREFKVTKADTSKSKPTVTITKLSAKDKKAKKV